MADPGVREAVRDLALVAALAAIGVGGFLFVNPSATEVVTGPGGLTRHSLPFIYSGLLLFLVALLGVSAFRRLRRVPASAASEASGDRRETVRTVVRRVLCVACILLYALGIETVGFAISTPLLLFAMLRILGRRHLGHNLVLALVGGLLLWILFVGVLKLPMTGLLWDPVTPVLNDLYRLTGAR